MLLTPDPSPTPATASRWRAVRRHHVPGVAGPLPALRLRRRPSRTSRRRRASLRLPQWAWSVAVAEGQGIVAAGTVYNRVAVVATSAPSDLEQYANVWVIDLSTTRRSRSSSASTSLYLPLATPALPHVVRIFEGRAYVGNMTSGGVMAVDLARSIWLIADRLRAAPRTLAGRPARGAGRLPGGRLRPRGQAPVGQLLRQRRPLGRRGRERRGRDDAGRDREDVPGRGPDGDDAGRVRRGLGQGHARRGRLPAELRQPQRPGGLHRRTG